MRQEFKADNLPEDLWDEAVSTIANRTDLEAFAKNNIESDLLRGQFYDMFFKDTALRQQEQQALAAPTKYINDYRAQEIARQNQLRELNARNFHGTLSLAEQDASY